MDNMFLNFPQTPEVVRAKEDLAEMMEDKYNELVADGKMENEAIGIVISEFGNIRELAEELGVTILEKGSSGQTKQSKKPNIVIEDKEEDRAQADAPWQKESSFRTVTDMEAEDYLSLVKKSAGQIATGVFLCICSPIFILLLEGIKDFLFPIPDSIVEGVGITGLLLMVAAAVGLFIHAGFRMNEYDYLKKECFLLDEGFAQVVFEMREAGKGMFAFKIAFGVVLCILSVVPILLAETFLHLEFVSVAAVAVMLLMVGFAVALFITAGMEEESYKVILQEKDFTVQKKSGKKIEEALSSIYWPLVVAVYLVGSFISGAWGITWLIWPVAGVLYPVISEMVKIRVREPGK